MATREQVRGWAGAAREWLDDGGGDAQDMAIVEMAEMLEEAERVIKYLDGDGVQPYGIRHFCAALGQWLSSSESLCPGCEWLKKWYGETQEG